MSDALIEDALIQFEPKEPTRESRVKELIERIQRKEEMLSHSSFNAFCKSPKHFLQYKLKERKTTPAMVFGSMVHCLILEPDEFNQRYFIAPKCDKRTKEGKATWAQAMEDAGERELTNKADYDKAKRIKDAVYSNGASRWVMDNITETEKAVYWNYGGYKWRGHIDGSGEHILMDLKKVVDADFRKVERLIRYEGYGRQAAHYLRSEKKAKDFYFVCFDDSANISVVKMSKGAIAAEYDRIEFYMNKFSYCAFKNEWNKSFDFYAPNGIYELR